MKWDEGFEVHRSVNNSGHGVPGDSSSVEGIVLGKTGKPDLEIRCIGCGSRIPTPELAYHNEQGKGPYCNKDCDTEKNETVTSES